MRLMFAVVAAVSVSASAHAQSLPAAQEAVEKILGDPSRQQAYCEALKLVAQIADEASRVDALGDKASPADIEQAQKIAKSYGEQAKLLWQQIDVDYTQIARTTSFAALRDPQSEQPYPGAEKFLQDQQEMNARCSR